MVHYNVLFKPFARVIVSHFALVLIFYLFKFLEFNFIPNVGCVYWSNTIIFIGRI